MSYVDFYVIEKNSEPQDFDHALSLVAGDDEAEWFFESLIPKLNGSLDEDDLDEIVDDKLICQYHNGIGDGGSSSICNAEYIANQYPEAFKALGVKISWGKGTAALLGKPSGSVG